MVFTVLILGFICARSLETSDFNNNTELGLFDNLIPLKRTKRDDIVSIKDKFPEHATVSCEELHQTYETPFTAIILYRSSGRLLCMGSILDAGHILSAKKCFEKIDYGDLKVLVGYYRAYWGNHAQVLDVKQIIRHEYELVILKLSDSMRFTEYVQAVRLPSSLTKRVEEFDEAFPPPYKVVGFYVDRFDVPGDYIDKTKLYMLKDDNFLSLDDCRGNYSKYFLEAGKLFCTFGNATFCWGGWGSPILKWVRNAHFIQIGVVVSDSCTSNSTGPSLAVRTDVYIDWIRGNSYHGHHNE